MNLVIHRYSMDHQTMVLPAMVLLIMAPLTRNRPTKDLITRHITTKSTRPSTN
jgi:hypothetical protein